MSEKRKKKKAKRAEKAREFARKKAVKAATHPQGYSTPIIQTFEIDNPLKRLSDSQQRELFAKLGHEAEAAFSKQTGSLRTVLKRHDPYELLATAAFYTQFTVASNQTDYTKDPQYSQSIIELLHSVALMYREDEYGHRPALHNDVFGLLETVKSCSVSFATKRYKSLSEIDDKDKHLSLLIESARLQTQMMRNWGFPQHMREIISELFQPIDDQIKDETGFSSRDIMALFDGIMVKISDRVTDFRNTVSKPLRHKSPRVIVSEFFKLIGPDAEQESNLLDFISTKKISPGDLRLLLSSYLHRILPDAFTFSVDECLEILQSGASTSQMQNFLDKLSLSFGELANENIEHLFMQSRIRDRPFVRLNNGKYFAPTPGLFNSNFIEIVESIIFNFDKLKKSYHHRRSVYLESKVKSLLHQSFPSAELHSGTYGINQIDNTDYENDSFIVLGPIAIVFECKSERVEAAARRGAKNTLKNSFKSMVREPAVQATRFARFLEEGSGLHSFKTTSGESFELDLTSIRRAVTVSVTLDWFPSLSMSWRQLLSAGVVTIDERPTIHLTLADLRVLLETLERQTVRLHYFWRRVEWDHHVDYFGDEEDVLVYYLSNGLIIPADWRNGAVALSLFGRSNELRRHYMSVWAEPGSSPPPRPRRLLTPWWQRLLERIEASSTTQKWDLACIILDLSFTQQQAFEEGFRKLIRDVTRGRTSKEGEGWFFAPEPGESQGALIGFAYSNLTLEERNRRAANLGDQALNTNGIQRAVVIGYDVNNQFEPYAFLSCALHRA